MNQKRHCPDCGRTVHGTKKVVRIEHHYPAWSHRDWIKHSRENVKKRLGKYLCRFCRNWLTEWNQGYRTVVITLEDGTIESFRSKMDKKWHPGPGEETKFEVYERKGAAR